MGRRCVGRGCGTMMAAESVTALILSSVDSSPEMLSELLAVAVCGGFGSRVDVRCTAMLVCVVFDRVVGGGLLVGSIILMS